MNKILLIGAAGSGKDDVIHTLTKERFVPKHCMAVEYCGAFVVAPDQFLENRRFYHALIATSQQCNTLLMLQSARAKTSIYPPNFASIFTRKVIGVISHADAPEANAELAHRFLSTAGARHILVLHKEDPTSYATLQELL